MAKTQKIDPIAKDPASPINTLAGWKLKKKNPIIVPDRTKASKLKGIFPDKVK